MSSRFTRKFMTQCGAEFLGTLFLAEIVGCITADPFTAGNDPIGIGFGLSLLVYTFGHISGAHLNPAVSFALFLRGACDGFITICYTVCQLLGALIGSGIAAYLSENAVGLKKGDNFSNGEAVSAEIFFTFLLCFVVMNVATTKANKDNPFFGFTIGVTVTASAYSVGEISGGAFNPAVATGIAAIGGTGDTLWIYWIGEYIGALFAGLAWYIINYEEVERERQEKKNELPVIPDEVDHDQIVNVDTGKPIQ